MDLTAALTRLQLDGIHQVRLHYDGSGDSGAIDQVEWLTEDEQPIPYPQPADVYSSIKEALEEKAYSILESLSDWYNNDGGYGTMIIHVSTGQYEVDHNIRIMEIDHESDEGNFFEEMN